jgi:DNA-binding Xre family transcriptional regulator
MGNTDAADVPGGVGEPGETSAAGGPDRLHTAAESGNAGEPGGLGGPGEPGGPDQPGEPGRPGEPGAVHPDRSGEAGEAGEQLPLLPGFREMALRRMAGERRRLVTDLTAERQAARLSQTEVAARMGTSQSAVARLESGEADARASTLERYAAAIGCQITWRLQARAPGLRREETQGDDPVGN